ncbi:unnamed protein product [Mytilus coruscus]|uniref:Uncharacterized protein n=1 Tax=Mytilus coruscus TaxID=42192 RepID=A0A6J8ES93_MYTCO|nr:unnamed protein product [Mytilus coruscus]
MKQKQDIPWLTPESKRLIRKRDRIHNKIQATKTENKSDTIKRHRSLKHQVQQKLRTSYWNYIENIIIEDSKLKDSKPSKKFWSFIKNQKSENMGVSPLKVDKVDVGFFDSPTGGNGTEDFMYYYALSALRDFLTEIGCDDIWYGHPDIVLVPPNFTNIPLWFFEDDVEAQMQEDDDFVTKDLLQQNNRSTDICEIKLVFEKCAEQILSQAITFSFYEANTDSSGERTSYINSIHSVNWCEIQLISSFTNLDGSESQLP